MEKHEASAQPSSDGVDVQIASELVEQARGEGSSLVGPDGLLTAVTRNVLQTARRLR